MLVEQQLAKLTFKEYLKEIESELYAALEALEEGDVVTVRQCSTRASAMTNDAWKAKREEEVDQNNS